MSKPSPSNSRSGSKNYDVVVIGGGAAGIIAAWRSAQLGAKTLLIEKTCRLGTKILISGGGKCNIAHAGPIEDILKAFRPNEARFIRPAVYRFPNLEIMRMFTDRGLRIYTRPDGRVFPVDQTAKDVVAILKDYLFATGVDVWMNTPVEDITKTDSGFRIALGEPFESNKGYAQDRKQKVAFGAKALLNEVRSNEVDDDRGHGPGEITAQRVILATGGSSYPNSGTTGDGWPWAKSLGHSVEWIHAALAPIYLELDPFDPARSGIALRDVIVRAKADKKEIARWRNDMLFTHQGVSGPTILGISRLVAEAMPTTPVTLSADLYPDLDQEKLIERFLTEAKASPKRQVATFLEERLPERIVPAVCTDAGVEPAIALGQLEKKARNRLIETLKNWPLGTVRTVSLEKGEVVAGGVKLDEVDPQSMRSKVTPGLYLCGEILDVAGPVGGYNLQAAFATGFVAGETAAQDSLETKAEVARSVTSNR